MRVWLLMLAIGDTVAAVLSACGLTKARVHQVTGKDCGCTKRQEALNRIGYAWQRSIVLAFYRTVGRLEMLRMSPYGRRLFVAAYHLRMAAKSLVYGN